MRSRFLEAGSVNLAGPGVPAWANTYAIMGKPVPSFATKRPHVRGAALVLAALLAPAATAQAPQTATQLVAAQQAAIAKLSGFNGLWRGQGWTIVDGRKVPETVTQRVGFALDGATQVMETRIFAADGRAGFHALNNVAYDATKGEYVIQARAEGRFGNFPFRATADGYVWELVFGGRGLRYTGTLKDGVWTQVSERIAPDRPPEVFAEFRVSRIAATTWPDGGAMGAR